LSDQEFEDYLLGIINMVENEQGPTECLNIMVEQFVDSENTDVEEAK